MGMGFLDIMTSIRVSIASLCTCIYFSPIAIRKAKIVYNFGLSECNRVRQPQ